VEKAAQKLKNEIELSFAKQLGDGTANLLAVADMMKKCGFCEDAYETIYEAVENIDKMMDIEGLTLDKLGV
jgi:hypothetical protein